MKITFALAALTAAVALATFVPKERATPTETIIKPTGLVLTPPTAAPSSAPAVDNSFEGAKQVSILSVNPENSIFILNEINESAVAIAQEVTEKSVKDQDLYILINSPGGSVLDGAQVVAAIQASPARVHTICLQLCASMAAIIHAYGHDRMMLDRAVLMYHDAAGGAQGYLPHMLSQLNTIDRYTKKMAAYIARRSGQTPESFYAQMSQQVWRDSEDATSQHYNDKIVRLNLKALTAANKEEVRNSVQQTKLKLRMGF